MGRQAEIEAVMTVTVAGQLRGFEMAKPSFYLLEHSNLMPQLSVNVAQS